ncbi:MAG: hypothetical protein R3F60_01890 [bacterium]
MTRALLAAALLAAAGFLAWRWSRPVSAPPAGERVVPTPPHEGRVSAVLPGSPVVSGDVTGRLVLWSEAGPTTFVAHDGAVRRLLRAGDGFASVGADGSVAFWGMDGAARRRLRLSEEPLNDAWIVGADVLASTARGTVARLADAGPVWKARGAHARTAFTVALQGSTVWSGGADGRVATWDLQSGASATGFEPGLGFIVALFPEGDGVLAVGQQGFASIGPAGIVGHARFGFAATCAARDGDRLAVAGEAGRVALYQPDGTAIGGFDTGDTVLGLAFDGPRLFTGGGADGRVRIWQVKDGAPLGTLPRAAAEDVSP